MSVEQYRSLMETAGRNGMRSRELARAQKSITDSLTSIGSEYSEMRQASLDLIKENNLKIITLIVEDYEERGEEIPLTWIPDNILIELVQRREIVMLTERIIKIDNEILERFGNRNGIVA